MQCLYCKKRLGLFTKKRFCSELHEVAYLDEQSGLAMRRIMDPLFTAPVEPAALRPTLPPQPPGANREPEIPAPVEKALMPVPQAPVRTQQSAIPARCNAYLKQRLPNPIPPEAIEDAPESREGGYTGPLEVELSPGPVQLPTISAGVLAFDFDFESPESESPELEAADLEPFDATPSESESQASLPEASSAEPAELTETLKIAYDLAPVDSPSSRTAPRTATYDTPLGAEPSDGAAHMPPIGRVAFDHDINLNGLDTAVKPRITAAEPLKIAYEPEPLDSPSSHTAPYDAPLEAERPDGTVHLPSIRGSVLPFDGAFGDLPEAAAPPLQPRLEQRLPALAEAAACRPTLDPAPLDFETTPLRAGLQSNENLEAPGIRAVDELLSLELMPWSLGFAAPSGESKPRLESLLDPRYPLAGIAIARETFQAPAELLESRWSAIRPSPLEQEPESADPSPEAAFALSTAFTAPIARLQLQPPFVSATPLSIFPAQPGVATRTHEWREPQSQPVPPSVLFATSFRLPFAIAVEWASTLPVSLSHAVPQEWPNPSAFVLEPGVPSYSMSCVGSRAPFWGELVELSARTWSLRVVAKPSTIFAAGTGEFQWPQTQPALPPVSRSFSFLLPQAGTAGMAGTGPVPPADVTPRQEPAPSDLSFEVRVPDFPAFRFDALFRGNLVQVPSRAEPLRLVGAKPLEIFPAGLEDFRWPHEAIALPSASCAKSYRLIFDGTTARAMTLSDAVRQAAPWVEPVPHVLAFEPPVPDSSTFHTYRGELPRMVARTSPPPLVHTQARAFSMSAAEDFRLPQARLTVPPVVSTNSHRLSSTGVAKRPLSTSAPAATAMTRQEPILLVLGFESPVADCAPFDHALLQAKPKLALRGFGLAGRNSQEEARELPTLAKLSAKPQNPNKALAKRLNRLSESRRTSQWSASKRVGILPLALKFRSEETRPIEPPINAPDIFTGAELFPIKGVLTRIAPTVHDAQHDGFGGLSSADLQRFRAAARIQIREALLRSSIPHDLPASCTNLPWAGARIAVQGTAAEILAGAKPVPLRPPLQTPEFAEV